MPVARYLSKPLGSPDRVPVVLVRVGKIWDDSRNEIIKLWRRHPKVLEMPLLVQASHRKHQRNKFPILVSCGI